MAKPHVRNLHRGHHAVDDDDLVAPVELVSFAGIEARARGQLPL
jgi:hypothetical protein